LHIGKYRVIGTEPEFFISSEFSNLRSIADKLFIAGLLGKRLLGEAQKFASQ
jgi:hypothetical protein